MTSMDRAKPYCIDKRDVWEAYKQVKANRGAAGVDGQSIEDFDRETCGGCGCQPSRAAPALSKIAQIGPPPLWPLSMPASAAFSQLFGAYLLRCTLRQSPCT